MKYILKRNMALCAK